MPTEKLFSIAVAVVLTVVIFYVVVWPQVRGWLADSGGVDAMALVKEISLSSVRDETKKQLYNLVLEVRPADGAPYVVKVRQAMPWMMGSGMAGHEVPVRVHKRFKSWVTVMPPRRGERLAS